MRGSDRWRPPGRRIDILSRDYWFKPVENCQTTWCLIDDDPGTGRSIAYFMAETSEVFDRMVFFSRGEAEAGLRWNGFWRLSAEPEDVPRWGPPPPFVQGRHPNGPIYSSGMFWRAPPPCDIV
jgi:hypothetical protein